jgi:hypothetical protein
MLQESKHKLVLFQSLKLVYICISQGKIPTQSVNILMA